MTDIIRRTISFTLIFLVSTFALSAQENQEWYQGKIIREIRFEGLQTIARSELEGITKDYLLKPFNNDLFRELQSRLYSLDYFDGVIVPEAQKADADGTMVRIVFTVTEKPTIDGIEYTGNKRLSGSDLGSAVTIKKGDMVNSAKIKIDERAIRDYYLERGFTDIKVSSETKPVKDSNRVTLYFNVEEGVQTTVKKIEFSGNNFANEGTLKGLMETKEQGLFDNGLFKEAKLTKDIQTIQNYYWDRGYIDAKITTVERKADAGSDADRSSLILTIKIFEGELYNFAGFSFEGNIVFSTQVLSDLVRQQVGKTLSKQKLDADYQRILDLYFENGYITTSIQKVEQRTENNISYTIKIVERARSHIENIIVKGNTKTKDYVILRELPLEIGDVFSKTKIVDGLRNLYNLQYFSSVEPETPQGSVDGLMDLVINVEEAQTAELVFGVAFSGATDFPVSGQIKWQDKNFFGLGQTFGLETNFSPVSQSLALNFTENWLMNQRFSLGGSLSFGHYTRSNTPQDVSWPIYDSDTSYPDPYDLSVYVFSQATSYNGTAYQAGQLFPGIPSAADIATYKLVTQYDYDTANNLVKSSGNTMTYDSYEFSTSVNGGYTFHTPVGRFGLGGGFMTSLQFVNYDANLYRPANKALRDNFQKWMFENSVREKGSWDTRDIILNPTSGAYLAETYSVVGGFLGGQTHYTRLDLKGEAYAKALDIPNLFDGYNYKLVFKLKSGFSQLFDPLGNDGKQVLQPKDQLYVDGMLNGRGWGAVTGGRITFNNSLEVKMPVVESLLWLEGFADLSTLIKVENSTKTLFDLTPESYNFSLGFGLKITNPQFPIGLYFAKPYKLGKNFELLPQKGDGIFGADADMKLVISFGLDLN